MTKIYKTDSPEETFALGEKLGELASPGDVVCLDGDLGAGKTVFAKGFAQGLGIPEPVVSPTFTILQIYDTGRLPLYHFDVYRIDDPDEMEEIGYEECFFGQGVTLIEWPSRIEELLPEQVTWVRIERDPSMGEDFRRITVSDREGGIGCACSE